jgi:hypothetical protein
MCSTAYLFVTGCCFPNNPICHFFVVLQEIVQMRNDAHGRAANGTHRVAEVAIFAEPTGVLVQCCELIWCACALTIEVDAITHGEVLVSRADHGTKGYCCNDFGLLVYTPGESEVVVCVLFEPIDVSRAGLGASSHSNTFPPPPLRMFCATAPP